MFNAILIYCFLILFLFYLHPRYKVWIELLDLSDSLKYSIPSADPIQFPIPNIYLKKGIRKNGILDNNLIIIINIFDLLFIYFYLFYLLSRDKVWIELLDLSNSLKYFIPFEII